MTTKIRSQSFETNSSTSHTITLHSPGYQYEPLKTKHKTYHIFHVDMFQSRRHYINTTARVEYALAVLFSADSEYWDDGITRILNILEKHTNIPVIIDHVLLYKYVSSSYYLDLTNSLDPEGDYDTIFQSDETLTTFIFNKFARMDIY